MCNDDIRNYNSKISDLGYLTYDIAALRTDGRTELLYQYRASVC